MESAANGHHHHHLQDQILGSSSPSCYGIGIGTTSHSWSTTTDNPILNNNGFHCYPIEAIMSSREAHSSSSSMAPSPDMSIHWTNNTIPSTNSQQDLLLQTRIKDELSHNYYPKYTEMLSSSLQSEFNPRNERKSHSILQQNEVVTKFLPKPYSSDHHHHHHTSRLDLSSSTADHCSNNRRGYGQIFPAFQVSSLNQMGMADPFLVDMNLEAIDLLASSRFSSNFGHNSLQNQTGILRDGFPYGFDHIHPTHQLPTPTSNKVSVSNNGVGAEEAEAKRKMEMKSSIENASKKSRPEARSSCPPLKVRKEKLGDRIAALQQLVAPFGKTDTASVLMEAIGYIKFLQNQVETLSVPYMNMKASGNKLNRAIKGVQGEEENEEVKRDLKSRGLCLVPVSCLSYIADGGGATVWAPPHLGGGPA